MIDTPKCCGEPMVLVEIQGVYDGGLFWECAACGKQKHRFPTSHPLRIKAERYMALGKDGR
jgi:hypothetical protein